MREISLRVVERRLHEAFDTTVCVQAWLGIADVLFLGFGQELIEPSSRRRIPPYELETFFSDWEVRDPSSMAGTGRPGNQPSAMVQSIVGSGVEQWSFLLPSYGLLIRFGNGCVLQVDPMPDEEFAEKEAWAVRGPDRKAVKMSCNGHFYLVPVDQPAS
jgi:hypothetical protein